MCLTKVCHYTEEEGCPGNEGKLSVEAIRQDGVHHVQLKRQICPNLAVSSVDLSVCCEDFKRLTIRNTYNHYITALAS